jgi:hypothetical protein
MNPLSLLLAVALAAPATVSAAEAPASPISPASATATSTPIPKHWTGTISVPNTKLTAAAYSIFEIEVFALTTDEEALTLVETLRVGGQNALRNKMFTLKQKGWIRIGNNVATEVGVLRVLDRPDGGRSLRLFSDHPLRLLDKTDPPGSNLHPFGFMELNVDANGIGDGRLIAAASLAITDSELTFESAGADVIVLRDVKADLARR